MKWLKQKWQENPDRVIAYVMCGTTTIAGLIILKAAKDIRVLEGSKAEEILRAGIAAFEEGYETAISEIEQIAENKELQKALKASSKAAAS